MPRSDNRGPRSRLLIPILSAASGILVLAGCGGGSGDKIGSAPGVSDTTAFRDAVAEADTTARIDALEAFLTEYPASPFRQGAYSRLYDMRSKRDPDAAAAFVREALRSEKDPAARGRLHYALYEYARDHAPGEEQGAIESLLTDEDPGAAVYNMVAWDLVERNTRLDDAVRLAAIGVEKAPDSLSKAMVLDTQGWAEYLRGNAGESVRILEEAVRYYDDETLEEHLAEAYEKAGRNEQARDLYAELLVQQEDPAMRARMEDLTRKIGGSVAEVSKEIDRRRAAAAEPASPFTLKDYAGSEISLADFKGKVVLLGFWHPT